MQIKRTQRGFELVSFKDFNHTACSLQQSSLAIYATPGSSAVWLGMDGMSGDVRMHLEATHRAASTEDASSSIAL